MRRYVKPACYALAGAGAAAFLWGAWIPVKAVAAQVLLDHAWAEVQQGNPNAKPWPWADTSPIAWVGVPRLGEGTLVLAGGQGRTLALGPGHVDGTALPGRRGHSVIGAHRDTHFAFLKDAKMGDEVLVERPDGRVKRYRVSDMTVLDITQERFLHHPDADLLTLVTCFPFDDWTPEGPLRFVVTAEAV